MKSDPFASPQRMFLTLQSTYEARISKPAYISSLSSSYLVGGNPLQNSNYTIVGE